MSFPAYPEYKDSGVEWLGEVPSHWEVTPLGYLCSKIGSGKTPSGGAEVYAEEGVAFLRSQNIYDEGLALDDLVYIDTEIDSEMSGTRVLPGDILMNITGASIGRTCLVPGDFPAANVNQHVCILRIEGSRPIRQEYAALFLKSANIKAQIDAAQTGAAREGLNFAQMAKLVLALPPQPEQSAIAAFLDRETGKIDALVVAQETLIGLLKEKRQAVISHAVTRGLDPSVPMKDSGIEWLGEVPSHWSLPKKIADLASRSRHSFVNGPFGSDLLTAELTEDGVPVIYIRDLKTTGYQRVSEWCVTPEKAAEISFCNVLSGDILIAKVGDPPGLAVLYPEGEPQAIVTQDVIRLRADLEQVVPLFLVFLLNSDYGQALIDSISVESTRTRVGLGDYKTLRFSLPPIDEQQAIADQLYKDFERMEALIAEAQRGIDLLKERRSALISAAVTGKIDVRGLVAADVTEAA